MQADVKNQYSSFSFFYFILLFFSLPLYNFLFCYIYIAKFCVYNAQPFKTFFESSPHIVLIIWLGSFIENCYFNKLAYLNTVKCSSCYKKPIFFSFSFMCPLKCLLSQLEFTTRVFLVDILDAICRTIYSLQYFASHINKN